MAHIHYSRKLIIKSEWDISEESKMENKYLENLPEGTYSFTGKEGIVKVIIHKGGSQSWDLENWFASLDPEINEEQRQQIINDIKQRLNRDTGIIDPPIKQKRNGFLHIFS